MGLWDSVTGFFEDLGDFFSGKDFFECAGYAWNDMMKLAHSKKSFPLKKSPKSSKNPVTESHNPTVITPFAGFLSFFYETPNNFKIAGTAIIIKPPITFLIA